LLAEDEHSPCRRHSGKSLAGISFDNSGKDACQKPAGMSKPGRFAQYQGFLGNLKGKTSKDLVEEIRGQ